MPSSETQAEFQWSQNTTVRECCLDPAADWFGFEIAYSGSIKQKKTKQKEKKHERKFKEIQIEFVVYILFYTRIRSKRRGQWIA